MASALLVGVAFVLLLLRRRRARAQRRASKWVVDPEAVAIPWPVPAAPVPALVLGQGPRSKTRSSRSGRDTALAAHSGVKPAPRARTFPPSPDDPPPRYVQFESKFGKRLYIVEAHWHFQLALGFFSSS
ncbi:hypothetical protein B0H17DRAFT_1279822 [Mycena rosella]|uniref:Uncharacterized protein n=1 Tax=Mycena rosella TaxID=1033263 RepID=A0AAD7DJF5_MYCRO|nr:hypothetical protein B0H17DRAFT_1279822 [Mycena rosella]